MRDKPTILQLWNSDFFSQNCEEKKSELKAVKSYFVQLKKEKIKKKLEYIWEKKSK